MKIKKIVVISVLLFLFCLFINPIQAQTPPDCPKNMERLFTHPMCLNNPDLPPCRMAQERCPNLPPLPPTPNNNNPIPGTPTDSPTPTEVTQNSDKNQNETKNETDKDTTEDNATNKKEIENIAAIKVIEIIDGDTIKVEINGNQERVRLIGVDAPEVAHEEIPADCFGQEAKEKMNALLSGKNIKLQNDGQTNDKDEYERLLRYVYLEDGTLINEQMIKDGYATVYDLYPFGKLNTFKDAEKEAKENKKGLHQEEICKKEEEPKKDENAIGEPAPQTEEPAEENTNGKEPKKENNFSPMFFTTLTLLLIVGISIIIVSLKPKKKKNENKQKK